MSADNWNSVAMPTVDPNATWDWQTDGVVCIGVLRSARHQLTRDPSNPGSKRQKTLAQVDVAPADGGAVATRTVWLPEAWLPNLRKCIGQEVRIERLDTGARTETGETDPSAISYALATRSAVVPSAQKAKNAKK